MKKIFAIALGILALAACSRQSAAPQLGSNNEVRFTTDIQTFTVKSASIDGNVRILAGAPINANEIAGASEGKLIPANKIYWVENQTETTTFGAIYPADHNNEPLEYDLAFGGSQDYAYHSTVLVATAKDVTPGDPVALNFKHPFANIVIKVTNSLEGTPAISKVELANAYSQGQISILAGTSAGSGKATINATPKEGEALTWQVLVFPGSAQPVIKVTVGADTYSFVLASAVNFEANKSYTAEIELKEGSTPPLPVGDEAAFTFAVTDWTDGEALSYAEEVAEEPAWYIIGAVYADDPSVEDWKVDFPMTKGDDGKLSVTINVRGGFKFRSYTSTTPEEEKWNNQLGFYSEYVLDLEAGYKLQVNNTSSSDIKVAEDGNYTFVIDPADDYNLTGTKN